MFYTLTVAPALDYHLTIPSLQLQMTNRSSYETLSIGGKGINVSAVLNNLGSPSVAWTFIAGFSGDYLKKQLQALGIVAECIHLQAGFTRINVKLHGTQAQETELNAAGPLIDDLAIEQLFKKLEQLQANDCLVLSGSLGQAKVTHPNLYAKLMAQIKARFPNFKIVVDTTGQALLNCLPYQPYLIKPNQQELAELVGTPISSPYDLEAACLQLHKQGANNIIVSLGKKGAYFATAAGKNYYLDAPSGTVQNTVGAGDSLIAGFLHAKSLNYADYHAFAYGVACGSATAFSPALANRELTEQLFSKIIKEQPSF